MSEKKGTAKRPVERAALRRDHGLVGDAHAGNWHRQVSLLSLEKIRSFNQAGGTVVDGDFGENLIVDGIDLASLPVGTLLRVGSALLEVTQIGKECHNHCQIYARVGDCIMPREGIFAKVLEDGDVTVGDSIEVVKYSVAILIASDKASTGQRVDATGPALREMLEQHGYAITSLNILPDEQEKISDTLRQLCDAGDVALVLTSGGTGFSPRDWTPEATLAVADRLVPGVAEATRAASLAITPRAMLSRGVAVIRGQTLIINLPGSPKGACENLAVVLPALDHGLDVLRGAAEECATDK